MHRNSASTPKWKQNGMHNAMVKLSRSLGHPPTVEHDEGQCVEAALVLLAVEQLAAPTLPNPAQLRTLARPAPDVLPCMPGRYCERHVRDLGGCIAGECNRPAPAAAKGPDA